VNETTLPARRIAVIPGDGIGTEVMPVAVAALQAVTADSPVRLGFESFDWSCDRYLATGRMMPEDGLDTLRTFDAIFLGAVGDPTRVPDPVSLWGLLLAIRRGLRQSVNIRPARLFTGMTSPLRAPGAFDIVVVRENSEGGYSEIGGTIHDGEREAAIQVAYFSRIATERVARTAFDLARRRSGRLTSATKSNGIVHSMPFWDRVVREVAADYPDVAVEPMHIDALLARLVREPERFDVIVAGNLFGDLLTDLTGALMGSIGIAPSANLDPDGVNPSMLEPVHGSAPDIAGRGIANPLGQAWTGVLMLEHLDLTVEADRLLAAIRGLIEAGEVTRDLGGTLTTSEVGARLLARIG